MGPKSSRFLFVRELLHHEFNRSQFKIEFSSRVLSEVGKGEVRMVSNGSIDGLELVSEELEES